MSSVFCQSRSPHQRLPCDRELGHDGSHHNEMRSVYWTDVKPEDQNPPDVDWLDAMRPTFPKDYDE